VSAFAFVSPVSSSMVAPVSNQIAAEFAITSEPVVAITVTAFVLAQGRTHLLVNRLITLMSFHQALGPLVFGPMSEVNIS
jgi:hypothetical protein